VSPSISHSNGTTARVEYQPLLHKCRAWREGRMSDHLDHVAGLERIRLAGLLFDDAYFDAVAIEARLDPAELAP
jgi:hypothetical protein